MYKLSWTILIYFLTGCRQAASIKEQPDFKDSVIQKHFSKINSLEFYDTIDYDFKVLKAYFNDDTSFFREMNENMDKLSSYPRVDSCVNQIKLSDLNCDEAYRFYHSQSFCDFHQNITIARSGDSVRLIFIEYSNGDGKQTQYLSYKGDTVTVLPYCVVTKQFNKLLPIKDWEKLKDIIRKADYWGLKPHIFELIVDGSSWRVDGYTKEAKYLSGQQIHSVSRQSPSSQAFKDIGIYLLKLSGERAMCGEFF